MIGKYWLQDSKKDFCKIVSQATEKIIKKLEDISNRVKSVHALFLFYSLSKKKERQFEFVGKTGKLYKKPQVKYEAN